MSRKKQEKTVPIRILDSQFGVFRTCHEASRRTRTITSLVQEAAQNWIEDVSEEMIRSEERETKRLLALRRKGNLARKRKDAPKRKTDTVSAPPGRLKD